MNFFSRFFKREPPKEKPPAQVINVQGASFTTFTGDAYANDIFRSAVDAIARNAAKLKGVHTVTNGDQRQPANDRRLQKLLQVSPNEYMTAYDMLYKLTSQYFLTNNAFAILDWSERGQLQGIYPVNYTHVDFKIDTAGSLYTEFTFRNGKKAIFSYTDVIHLRRHFNGNEFLGDDNRAIDPALELAHTQNEGLMQSIKSSANLRGILKFTQLLSQQKLKELKDKFVAEYLTIANDGGVVATDTQMEYTPIENKPVNLDEKQLQAVKEKIYGYLGISEKIVNSSYSEDDFAAFYESVIEPLAVQMSLEFTKKIFNDREQAFGNAIVFESGRLQFTSNATKVNLIKELMPLGLLTINQALEVLNLAPVEGGEKRLQTLNVVDFDKATEYQLARAGKKNGNTDCVGNADGTADET